MQAAAAPARFETRSEWSTNEANDLPASTAYLSARALTALKVTLLNPITLSKVMIGQVSSKAATAAPCMNKCGWEVENLLLAALSSRSGMLFATWRVIVSGS